MDTTTIFQLTDQTEQQFEKRVNDLMDSSRLGQTAWTAFVGQYYPVCLGLEEFRSMDAAKVSVDDARFIVARSFGFESWYVFSVFLAEVKKEHAQIFVFESAVDAVVNGDLEQLNILLQQNPWLIKSRSMRVHSATLLHYTSANGVENFRQKTPENIVEIVDILLHAGSEVDATLSDGESTTLGLTATSAHPRLAGVQLVLLDRLMKAGACAEGIRGGWQPLSAAIANGCPEAARFLSLVGTPLYDIAMLGNGSEDWISGLFVDQQLRQSFTNKQLEAVLAWACEYGQNTAIELLLASGLDLHSTEYTGLSALHWALAGGQLETIRLLLKHGASLEVENYYGGTALNQALWWPLNGKPLKNYVAIIEVLLEAGANAEPGTLAWIENQNGLSDSDKEILQALFRRHGFDN